MEGPLCFQEMQMVWVPGEATSFAFGLWSVILVLTPVIAVAASVGVWLFYVQHQFEEAFWETRNEWEFVEAALSGSSYYRLPKLLQWFTGSIGLHHIHHLDARIPNYHLQACHDEHPELAVVEFSLFESLGCLKAKLWDPNRRVMVGFEAIT